MRKIVHRCSILLLMFSFTLADTRAVENASVVIFDNPGDTSGDLTGDTDLDPIDNRNLTIYCKGSQTGATNWHVYIRKGFGGMKYLGATGAGNDVSFDWYPNAPRVSKEFENGPDFNSVYTFRMIRIDGSLGPDDFYDMTGAVGFNLEGGNKLSVAQPEPPYIKEKKVVICDDILGIDDIAPQGSIGSDMDRADWRAIQIAWNFDVDPATVNEYHVYVSVDGANFTMLGQTLTGKINYFWWTPNQDFKTKETFINGPENGHTYQFKVFLMPLDPEVSVSKMVSGKLMYQVEEEAPDVEPTPTPTQVIPSTEIPTSIPTLIPTAIPTAIPTNIPTSTPTNTPTPTSLTEITIDIPNLPAGAMRLEMILIPSGTFMMGSPDNEKNRGDDEGPRHQVTITQDFYLGKYEVTQAQWEAIMGSNPSNDYGVGNNYPVYYVSWNDCQTFIGKMNELGQGLFRLPSEAEWEYACRAGTETAFYWGEDSDYTMIHDYAWFNGNNSPDGVKEVGLKLPNDWGLFDMSGNVAEWCLDVYDVHYYGKFAGD